MYGTKLQSAVLLVAENVIKNFIFSVVRAAMVSTIQHTPTVLITTLSTKPTVSRRDRVAATDNTVGPS